MGRKLNKVKTLNSIGFNDLPCPNIASPVGCMWGFKRDSCLLQIEGKRVGKQGYFLTAID
jgi:hypothetical protein